MEIQPQDEVENVSLNRSDSISSLTSSSSRQLSDSGYFSDLLNAWEAELDAQESRLAASTAGASTSNGATPTNSGGGSGGADVGSDGAASGNGGVEAGNSGADTGIGQPRFGSSCGSPSGGTAPEALQGRAAGLTAAESMRRPTSGLPQPAAPTASGPLRRRPVTAGAGGPRGGCLAAGASKNRLRTSESSKSTSSVGGLLQSSLSGGVAGTAQRRRAAFVAGSISASRKPDASSTPARDVLLPRLPAPALDLIIPALPAATRAALRCASKGLRALVDAHTLSLTLRPDRLAAEGLNRRGTKVFTLFPALRHATVVLAGSCSGAAGPAAAPAASLAAVQQQQPTANAARLAAAGRRPASAAAAGTAASGAAAATAATTAAAAAAASPPLPLAGWLVVCGTARCLTSLTMHLGEVALLEDLALSVTHPHLQRLDLFMGRSGKPYASPPVVQFMVGVLPGLRHLGMTWAGGQGGGGGSGSGAGAARGEASSADGLFLDGRPRLGPLLLAALGDLQRLESLELRGFLIDMEGHAVMARTWPLLAGRLQRLVLSGLHLLVPEDTPLDQQLGDLPAACCQLKELRADLWLPMSVGVPGMAAAAGGQGGAAAAALLLGRMHAARDVRAVRPEMLPASLTRLSLPGVRLTSPDHLAPLARLRNLTNLEVTALGSGAGEYLTALQELRLVESMWEYVLDMLPWKQPPAGAVRLSVEQLPAGAAQRSPRAGGAAAARQEPARPAGQAAVPGAAAATAAVPTAAAAAAAADAAGRGVAAGGRGPAGPSGERARGAASGEDASAAPCGQLRVLEVTVCERLLHWDSVDRSLLAKVGKALLPLVDGGCKIRLKVAEDALPKIGNEDGKPWECTAVWQRIRDAQNRRRLEHRSQAEMKALAERLARGRQLQAARRKDKEWQLRER